MGQSIDDMFFNVPQTLSAAEWKAKRAHIESYINVLIEKDFARLVELLYRVDISEKKLKTLLAATAGSNSAALITDLILERQLQKIASRQNQQPGNDIPEEDKW